MDTSLSIIVIDDDVMVLRALENALKELGLKTKTFSKGKEGIDWIAQNGADIVITDICMPECDGFSVLKQVKEIDPLCDIIFITAHSRMDIAIRALREGATDFIEKPLNTTALQAGLERTSKYRNLLKQKKILSDQVDILKSELFIQNQSLGILIGISEPMKIIARQILDISNSNVTVLITGESGTGKELVARAIHHTSSRKDDAFITVNCPSIPEDLFESEMFGHRKGAFTGAHETRGGYVEAAEGGSIFLDEIGDLPLKSQSKILRLLEQKTYLPIGENREKTADIRIISATNQALDELVKTKSFREDLLYRLKVCNISIPPLRERRDDIPLLAQYFCMRFSSEMNKPIDGISPEAMITLRDYDYPGNVRELRNIIESSIIHCPHKGLLDKKDLSLLKNGVSKNTAPSLPEDSLRFEDAERKIYMEALQRSDNNVSAAARILGLSRGKFRRRLEALNINN